MKNYIILGLFFGVVSVAAGIQLIKNTHHSRLTWNKIEKLLKEKEELNIEYTQLQLEQSMLVTGAILDSNIRTRLNMVIPNPQSIVYLYTPDKTDQDLRQSKGLRRVAQH